MRSKCFFYLIVELMWAVNGSLVGDLQNCDHLGVLLYEDLGCVPHYDEGNPCPTNFSCNFLTGDNATCVFRGKEYGIGEEVADNLIAENCFYDCKCMNPAGFHPYECLVQNCSEWSGFLNGSVCYHKYAVDQCCALEKVCGRSMDTAYRCNFEGTIYREGQLFVPSDTCNKCSCRKGFKGIVEEPFCKRTLCATQFVAVAELESNCAPLYVPTGNSKALCCPLEWVCYSGKDDIKQMNPDMKTNTNGFCNFGPEMVAVGQGFTRVFDYFGVDTKIRCECLLPPLMTCRPS